MNTPNRFYITFLLKLFISRIDFNVVYQYQCRTGFRPSLLKSVLMFQIGQHWTVSHVYGKYLQILFLTVVTRGGRGEKPIIVMRRKLMDFYSLQSCYSLFIGDS